MVLTDKARAELLGAIVDFLQSQKLTGAAAALVAEAAVSSESVAGAAGLLEKKWTSVLRLQKKVRKRKKKKKKRKKKKKKKKEKVC